MEIKDFAEHILFGNTLEAKLIKIDQVQDTEASAITTVPKFPHRPKNLQPSLTKTSVSFPKRHQIESHAHARGQVLHFFANHELLALELMALVLLKFPEAPFEFRKGLVYTMMEEQDHMRLYMQQMERHGIGFGEIPVNDFFWRTISQMKSPMDFVVQMSLTFEQANLDYALFYKHLFETIEDRETADVLTTVYEDEIRHVTHGLTWFREWKDPQDSDWDAYTKHLTFPLTPQRAKGIHFSHDARTRAGLDNAFISKLELYSRSKGKTPNVYFFNPACEQEIVAGTNGFSPQKNIQMLEDDLSVIPFILAGKEDIVLVNKQPSPPFLKTLKDSGFQLPEFILSNKQLKSTSLANRKLNELRPWGWSPKRLFRFSSVLTQTSPKFQENPYAVWNEHSNHLFKKTTAHETLLQFLDEFSAPYISSKDELGTICASVQQMETVFAHLKTQGYKRAVLKAPTGSSGHHLYVLDLNGIYTDAIRWAEGTLKRQGHLLVEPWLEKLIDFSMQFRSELNGKLTFLGFARFETDQYGQYISSHLGLFDNGLSPELLAFLGFRKKGENISRLGIFAEAMVQFMKKQPYASHYAGHFGIDAMVYKSPNGPFKIRPIVEVNCRFTMGHIALKLSKHLAQNAWGNWRIYKKSDLKTFGYHSFRELIQNKQKEHPLILNAEKKIVSGFLPTNDPDSAQMFLSALEIK